MTITVITVHPDTTIVRSGTRQFELPTKSFPHRPAAGQDWELQLNRVFHERDKVAQLNTYLRRS